jgi:DNA-binding PadR family transcriptional regulator
VTELDSLTQELRRGVIVLAILSQLDDARYGYALMKRMSDKGLEIDQGTLYPLLRRLESRGFLESEWQVEGSPRRYYKLSKEGEEMLPALKAEWTSIVDVMDELLADI